MFQINDEVFNLIQTIALILSFVLSFITLLFSIRTTKINNGLLINQHHRELWLEFCSNDSLSRIFEENIDLLNFPLTFKEKQFMNMIFLHSEESYIASKRKGAYKIEGLYDDILDMLSYPIPMIVWKEYSPYYDKMFVKFVQNIIDENKLSLQNNSSKDIKKVKIVKSQHY